MAMSEVGWARRGLRRCGGAAGPGNVPRRSAKRDPCPPSPGTALSDITRHKTDVQEPPLSIAALLIKGWAPPGPSGARPRCAAGRAATRPTSTDIEPKRSPLFNPAEGGGSLTQDRVGPR